MCNVGATILMVGTGDKHHALRELPLRLVTMGTAADAISCLKKEKIDSVVSTWQLIDVPDGRFLEAVVGAIPSMPTIAFIEPGNLRQEIEAARIGVTAVLSEDTDDRHFREVICQLLGISDVAELRLSNILEPVLN